ncbi:hypothetical protein AB4120_13150 [Cupriavidus sp. 2KB_3]|uniref:hypothetical protein n=1 Tax=Cupriavidus TaxID=106589 RepID=UPI0011EC5C13|nr:hypothetical protein [Cupriavidus campinensis]
MSGVENVTMQHAELGMPDDAVYSVARLHNASTVQHIGQVIAPGRRFHPILFRNGKRLTTPKLLAA